MKINKKGFTLVELLAVIVLIGLLSSVALISYTAFIDKTEERVYKTYENTMKATAEMYLIDNSDKIPSIGNSETIYLNDLLSANEIDPISNPDDSTDICSGDDIDEDSYIRIIRNNDVENNINLTYEVCLRCSEYRSEVCIVND